MHDFLISLNSELEIDGEKEEVPDQVETNRDWRYTLCQRMVLIQFFDDS